MGGLSYSMARHVYIDTSDLDRLRRQLETLARKGLPHAVRNGLNRAAHAVEKSWKREIQGSFTLRNKWTLGSIRVEHARGLQTHRMESRVGSLAGYLATQEHGGTQPGAMAMPAAAGQGGKRTRAVRAPNRRNRLGKAARGKSGSKAQRNAIAIAKAQAGSKVAYLDFNGNKGLFKISGPKRKPKVKQLWSLRLKTHRVAPEPTLQRTLKRMEQPVARIFMGAFKEQLKRAGFR